MYGLNYQVFIIRVSYKGLNYRSRAIKNIARSLKIVIQTIENGQYSAASIFYLPFLNETYNFWTTALQWPSFNVKTRQNWKSVENLRNFEKLITFNFLNTLYIFILSFFRLGCSHRRSRHCSPKTNIPSSDHLSIQR